MRAGRLVVGFLEAMCLRVNSVYPGFRVRPRFKIEADRKGEHGIGAHFGVIPNSNDDTQEKL
jgi:hypothetical protein